MATQQQYLQSEGVQRKPVNPGLIARANDPLNRTRLPTNGPGGAKPPKIIAGQTPDYDPRPKPTQLASATGGSAGQTPPYIPEGGARLGGVNNQLPEGSKSILPITEGPQTSSQIQTQQNTPLPDPGEPQIHPEQPDTAAVTGDPPATTTPQIDTLTGAAPYVPGEFTPQGTSFVPQEATETGVGKTYTGQSYAGMSEEDILAASQKGLIGMLEEDNPYMQLARKQGARQAESRGLGGSSLRERAAQGAAIESAMPLVQQAGQAASAERQTAQQATAQSQIAAMNATAQSEVAAGNRRLSEMQQQYELAVQSGDTAKARELEAAMQEEQNRLSQWTTQAGIASNEAVQNAANTLQDMMQNRQLYSNEQIAQAERDLAELTQQRDIAFREEQAGKDRDLQTSMQAIDIDYKQWLEEATFEHQGILQGNAQAASAYSDFTEAAMNILNNPETSSAQKTASLNALKQALSQSLSVISATADIDLSQFLPGGSTGAGTNNTATDNLAFQVPGGQTGPTQGGDFWAGVPTGGTILDQGTTVGVGSTTGEGDVPAWKAGTNP